MKDKDGADQLLNEVDPIVPTLNVSQLVDNDLIEFRRRQLFEERFRNQDEGTPQPSRDRSSQIGSYGKLNRASKAAVGSQLREPQSVDQRRGKSAALDFCQHPNADHEPSQH